MPAYTWATGETITAAKLNALETEAYRVANQIQYDDLTGSVFTTSSTSLVDVTNWAVTFTPASTSVYVLMHCVIGSNQAGATTVAGGAVGVRVNSVDYEVFFGNWISSTSANDWGIPGCGIVKITGLTAGVSYTAQARARRGFGQSAGNFIVGGTNGAEDILRAMVVIDIVK